MCKSKNSILSFILAIFYRKIINTKLILFIEKCHLKKDPFIEMYCYGICYLLYNFCIKYLFSEW